MHNLAPAALEHDELPGALEKTVAAWAEQHRVRADFTVTGTVEPVHDEIAATLLRIAGEALANAARHAGASRVGVTLSFMDDELTLDVRDDGRGFDPAAAAPASRTGGFGLGGMRARAERIMRRGRGRGGTGRRHGGVGQGPAGQAPVNGPAVQPDRAPVIRPAAGPGQTPVSPRTVRS